MVTMAVPLVTETLVVEPEDKVVAELAGVGAVTDGVLPRLARLGTVAPGIVATTLKTTFRPTALTPTDDFRVWCVFLALIFMKRTLTILLDDAPLWDPERLQSHQETGRDHF
jgi:hypothetical protein